MSASPEPTTAEASPRRLFQSILQGSGLYSVATIAQRIGSLILLPILTRNLTPNDYGVMELLDQIGSVLSTLLGGNFSSALGYFYFGSEAHGGRDRVVGTTIVGAAMIGALASLVCWPFAGALSRLVFGSDVATLYLRILLSTMPLSFALEGFFGWLRVEDRPGMYVVWSLGRMGVTILAVLVLVAWLHLKVLGMLLSSAAMFGVVCTAFAIYCWRHMRPVFKWGLFVRIAKFTAPIGAGSLALFIINFGDRFFLRPYVSLAQLGLYALAYKIGMLVSVAFSSFYSYWGAQVYGIMKRDDADHVFARIQTYTTLGLAALCLSLAVAAKPILRLMATPAYYGAAKLVPLIVFAYGVRSLGDFFRSLYYVAGRPGADAICNWLGAALCLGGYAVLIPRFGVWGAAAATAAAFTVIGIICVVWTYRLRPFRLETLRLVKIALAAGVSTVFYALAPDTFMAQQIASGTVVLLAFPATLALLRFLNEGERSALASAIRRVRGGA